VQADTAALLEALERHREVRGSLPLFDGLLRDDPAAVQAAIADAPVHPVRDAVEGWLRARGVDVPVGSDSAAARELASIRAEATLRERRLAEEAADARRERDVAVRAANAYAAMCVLLAMIAIGGWLAAFGVVPFHAEGPTPTADSSRAPP
jgi:hypothetical protein